MAPKTILEHTDEILALPRGTWLVTTAEVTAGVLPQGGTIILPAGKRLRVEAGYDSLGAFTEEAQKVNIWRHDLAHVQVEATDPQAS